jgi:carbon monoxide dehydrogenase subunit G
VSVLGCTLAGMTTVSVSRTAMADPARVWALATDIAGWAETMSGIDAVEVLERPAFGVGTRWRETRTMMGRPATEEMWVSALEEGRSYTVESDSHGAHYTSVFTFRPTPAGGTEISLTFTGEASGRGARLLAALTAPLARRSVAKALEQDLIDLARAAEEAPA